MAGIVTKVARVIGKAVRTSKGTHNVMLKPIVINFVDDEVWEACKKQSVSIRKFIEKGIILEGATYTKAQAALEQKVADELDKDMNKLDNPKKHGKGAVDIAGEDEFSGVEFNRGVETTGQTDPVDLSEGALNIEPDNFADDDLLG